MSEVAASEQLRPEVVAAVRRSVRAVLERTPGFQDSSPADRKALAHRLVRVALAGAKLAQDDADVQRGISARAAAAEPLAVAASADAPAPLAVAAGEDVEGFDAGVSGNFKSAKAAGQAIEDIKNAINFPTYVSSLITGVFTAITQSSVHQIQALTDMLDHVSSSAEDFANAEVNDDGANVWAASKFRFLTVAEGGLQVRDGQDIDDHKEEMKRILAASDDEISAIDDSDLTGTLVPLVRRKLGRDRQSMLGTLIQLGIQRVVVDDGRLHASMDMRVDTRSAQARDRQNRQDLGVHAAAEAQVGTGIWGAKVNVSTDFTSVQSDSKLSKEEMDTRAGLRSSVDLAFRTEQIPLDRLADEKARVKLEKVARVPADVTEKSILDPNLAATKVESSSIFKDASVLKGNESRDLRTPPDPKLAAQKKAEDEAKKKKAEDEARKKKAEDEPPAKAGANASKLGAKKESDGRLATDGSADGKGATAGPAREPATTPPEARHE